MHSNTANNVLIIGGPNAGKTHFGGQLYGRLNSRKFLYKISPDNLPADLTIFQEVLDRLAEGRRAGHTEASANRSIELKIEDEKGSIVSFAFPDYAGEQVNGLVELRRINSVWKKYLEDSVSWMLFIRLDEISPLEDIVNREIPSAEEIQKRKAQAPPVKVSDAAYFVELIQILLYGKGISTFKKINTPNLTIILSCWDVLKLPEGAIPSEVLETRLPLVYHFIKNIWAEKSLAIIGLSSTGKTLTDEPDDEYIDKTPINFGYIINSKGEKQEDLTLSINTFIGNQ
jgi:hypothetical protein